MPRPVVKRIQHYGGKIVKHLAGAVTRREKLGEAVSGAVQDAKKMKRTLVKKATPHHHKKALEYAKLGVKEYNARNFKKAAYYFRHAVDEDRGYVQGYMYLGNAQYKREKLADAVTAWQTVVALEGLESSLGQSAQVKLNRAAEGKEGLSDLMELARGKIKERRTK